MSAPCLNRRLILEDAQREADGAGGHRLNWVPLGVLWARIDAGTGRERAGEFLTVSSVSYRITVRAAPFGAPSRPKPEQRFRDGARVFRVTAVSEEDPGGRYLTCWAQEEVVA
ncbi:MAG: head-tail adaptor protein [Paracoccaceae bacterium]